MGNAIPMWKGHKREWLDSTQSEENGRNPNVLYIGWDLLFLLDTFFFGTAQETVHARRYTTSGRGFLLFEGRYRCGSGRSTADMQFSPTILWGVPSRWISFENHKE
jgi:hypothetical protein